MLKYEDLSPNKQVFLDWLATPEFVRKIKTQRELADKLGVSEVTLSRWKKDENIIKLVIQRKKDLAGVELLPKIIDAIAVRATKTNEDGQKYANKDAELFFKWFFGENFNDGAVDINVSQTNISYKESLQRKIESMVERRK